MIVQLTSVQSDLVALLHEIGGVIEEDHYRISVVEEQERLRRSRPARWEVRLVMTGDSLRRVRVLIGPYGDVEWEVIGEPE